MEIDEESGEQAQKVYESKKDYWETKEELEPFGDRFDVGISDYVEVKFI